MKPKKPDRNRKMPDRPGPASPGTGETGGFRPKPKHAAPRAVPAAAATDGTIEPSPAAKVRRTGRRPSERLPVILETPGGRDHALIDTGDGEKLERYGAITIVRPEQQAIWPKAAPDRWADADAIFTGDTDEEGVGRWRFPKKPLGETWAMAFDDVAYLGRFTSFRHVGVFPEQATHWRAMQQAIATAGREVSVLNLFGYTGVASLVAAKAGARVTHVDASKKAVGWARENQEFAGLEKAPIRWICDDAPKFVAREARRGNTYDIILLDPPAYGRGPAGEVWQLFDHLPAMLDGCRDIMSQKPLMLVLTAYAIRASFYAMHEAMAEAMTGFAAPGRIESGELIIREEAAGRALSTSMFSRWVADAEAGAKP